MVCDAQRLQNLCEIRRYVTQTLCQKDQLESGFFPVVERVLDRGGTPCGVYFCLLGPRSLRLTAIWDARGGTILFYGSRGERFLTTRLIDPPRLTE
jgi:hypothetical protein